MAPAIIRTVTTNTTLTIAQNHAGRFRPVLRGGQQHSGGQPVAKATVLSTTKRPTHRGFRAGLGTPNATGATPYLVKVLFNKRIDPTTGGNPLNYSVPGTIVSGVTLLGDVRATCIRRPIGGRPSWSPPD